MIAAARAIVLAAAVLAVSAPGASAAPALEPLDQTVCRLIDTAARTNDLPVAFMTRVIWRESSFRAAAVSPKGAEGIAQFMPATAGARGLRDPFDPRQAIAEAARLLAALRGQFGNLGLAAAAYNAGPARVASWLVGQGGLPAETRAYVRFVTARDAAARPASGPPPPDGVTGSRAPIDSCLAIVAALRRDNAGGTTIDPDFAPFAPWGVQLAGSFSKPLALAEFRRAAQRYAAAIGGARPMIIGQRLRHLGTRRYYAVRLPAATRAQAELLCRRIRAVGGACVALRS